MKFNKNLQAQEFVDEGCRGNHFPCKSSLTLLMLFAVLLLPEMAFANVDALFKGPPQKILDLLTGTIAGLLVALSVVVAGIAYIVNKDDVSGWVMVLTRVSIGGVIMYGGGHIAKWWFG